MSYPKTIAEVREKCKSLLGRFRGLPRDILIFGVFITASGLSFGLGYLTGRETGQGSAAAALPPTRAFASSSPATEPGGTIVASKSGTKYYLTTCAGARRISDSNKVYFDSVASARAAGYTPAANCAGL